MALLPPSARMYPTTMAAVPSAAVMMGRVWRVRSKSPAARMAA